MIYKEKVRCVRSVRSGGIPFATDKMCQNCLYQPGC